MDKSLDDIISANKGKFSLRRGGRGGSRGAKRGGSGGARNTRGGGGGGAGRRGRGFSSPRGGVQKNRQTNYNRGPIPDVWSHDKFSDNTRGAQNTVRGIGKLHISNLDFGVNDSDINELFAEFGPMKKAAVHYDKSGRSLGTAEVWYERQADAAKALKQYNNVPLDGRPMNIQLVGGAVASSAPAASRIGTARGGAGGGRSPRGGFGGGRGRGRGGSIGRGGRGRGGRRGPPPKAEDLDAELDAYRNKMDTAS